MVRSVNLSVPQGKKATVFALWSLLVMLLHATPAKSQDNAALQSGVAAYNRKDYRTAVSQLNIAIAKGSKQPTVYLYLGHAYYGVGDQKRALATYCTLMSTYPASPEAQSAFHQSVRIDAVAASKYSAILPQARKVISAPGKENFIDRLAIVSPQFGHQPVRQRTIEIVKQAIRKIRAPYYKMLSDSGATLTISPNSMDRWPGHPELEMKIDGADLVIGEVGGQTYHRENNGPDINIFERPMVRGSTKLKEPFTDSAIYHCSIHELGHAIDDLMRLSLNSDFLTRHQMDVSTMSEETKDSNGYYLKPAEACGEITGALIGDNASDEECNRVMNAFPRSTQWLRTKLGI
jgi:hypothetical protein